MTAFGDSAAPYDDPAELPTATGGVANPAAPLGVAPAAGNIDEALQERLRQAKAEKTMHARRTREAEQTVRDLEAQLVDQYTAAGKLEHAVAGYRGKLDLVLWAKRRTGEDGEPVSTAQVVEALRADGMEELITPESYNHMQLSARLRELDDANEPMPEHLAEVIEPNEVPVIRFSKIEENRAARRLAGRGSSLHPAGAGD